MKTTQVRIYTYRNEGSTDILVVGVGHSLRRDGAVRLWRGESTVFVPLPFQGVQKVYRGSGVNDSCIVRQTDMGAEGTHVVTTATVHKALGLISHYSQPISSSQDPLFFNRFTEGK